MVYLDTNVLVYAGIEQDIAKKDKALCLIRSLAEASELHLSVLVLQELVFTMAKLHMDADLIKSDFDYYSRYLSWEISLEDFIKAVQLGLELDNLRNINDLVHLKVAERYCSKLITFDRDFKKMQGHTHIEIEILS
ncbi:MAG TPA: PIN domain-containing protein [Candidatus Rifleibacterium sp.]|nr:PIN domain-containing protein [Candidatus Rifleibacterium sp.]